MDSHLERRGHGHFANWNAFSQGPSGSLVTPLRVEPE